jgi:hypothetical protein
MWFIHPRRVAHNFWSRLNLEPSSLLVGKKNPSFSELAFLFLRTYTEQLRAATGPLEKVVLALPGSYLKDAATEEEKIGLVLGMAGELKLPLAGLIDSACAALCDPRALGFNPALPVVVVDIHLDGADITLFTTADRLKRRDYLHLPQSGLALIMKQLTGTMGNRFLRHTAFDILEDGRIEQTFFRQTKEFLVSGASEHRYHINTATRGYEMIAKRDQLVADASGFVGSLVQGLRTFLDRSPHASEPCTIALTDRAGRVPGLESRLRATGFGRILRLPWGASACGAARLGASRMTVAPDLSDVPLETGVPLGETCRLAALHWEARLVKNKEPGPRVTPTHAILAGIGCAIGRQPRFTIGPADMGADLALPASLEAGPEVLVPLQLENGRIWFSDSGSLHARKGGESPVNRTAIEAGDRLIVRCGDASTEILFAECRSAGGARPD